MRRIQGGGSDIQLNQTGKQQAESLALRLKQERIQAIYSSQLQRAIDTAQAIARNHQIKVEIEPALTEIDVGELEGAPVAKIGSYLDQLLVREGSPSLKRHGGESLTEVQQRAWGTIQRLVSQHRDGAIVVVSHYFVITTIICSVLNMPLSQIINLRISAGSISIVVFDEQAPRLVLFNDVCHLATT